MPHPNAAKLFINWFLSRKGQQAACAAMLQDGGYVSESRRVDLPTNKVLPYNRVGTVKYLDLSTPGLEWTPVRKVFEQSLRRAGKIKWEVLFARCR